jgi:uroporphyrinogen-III decarboxylase
VLLASEYYGILAAAGGCWDIYNFEARSLGQAIKTAEHGLPDVDYTNPLFKSEADLDKLKWPAANPLDSERYKLLLKCNELMTKYTGMPPALFMQCVTSFTLACELCSFAGFMKIIKKNPELAHEIIRRLVDDVLAPLIRAVAQKYPGINFKMCDAWELIPNISPKIEREFVWPYYDRIKEAVKDANVKTSWWCTYGEGAMPDPGKYIREKMKYNGVVSFTDTEKGVPRNIYRDIANECDVELSISIPGSMVFDGPPAAIIEYMRNIVKDFRYGAKKFSWAGLIPFSTPPEHVATLLAAGNALSVNPCPTPGEVDRMEIAIPKLSESFGDFVRRKAKENPDGYTFKWLDQAKFYGE